WEPLEQKRPGRWHQAPRKPAKRKRRQRRRRSISGWHSRCLTAVANSGKDTRDDRLARSLDDEGGEGRHSQKSLRKFSQEKNSSHREEMYEENDSDTSDGRGPRVLRLRL